jgi:hypothetical protein
MEQTFKDMDYVLWYVYGKDCERPVMYLTNTYEKAKLLEDAMIAQKADIEADELWLDYDIECSMCNEKGNGVLMNGNLSGMCVICTDMIPDCFHSKIEFTQPTPLAVKTVHLATGAEKVDKPEVNLNLSPMLLPDSQTTAT